MAEPTTSSQAPLLNTKQAAALLNVSEVSLRRWTDMGKLACMRVGPKRERRFRRDDLLAFLEGGALDVPAAEGEAPIAKPTQILLEGIAIDYGTHLCSLYETDLGRIKLAVPFLADGIRAGDICFVVASPPVQANIFEHLGAVHPDLDDAVRRGQLVALPGSPSGETMYEYLERQFIMATRHGNQNLRVLGDMAWFLDNGLSIEELFEFEARYNHTLAHSFPVIALCQYDVRRFDGKEVLDALKCHEDTFRYPLSRFLGV